MPRPCNLFAFLEFWSLISDAFFSRVWGPSVINVMPLPTREGMLKMGIQ